MVQLAEPLQYIYITATQLYEAMATADQITMEGAAFAGGSKGDRDAIPKKARKKSFQRVNRPSRTPVYRTVAHVLAQKQQQVQQQGSKPSSTALLLPRQGFSHELWPYDCF